MLRDLRFHNLCGNSGVYEESPSVFVPRVRLGAALPGLDGIPRPAGEVAETGLRIEKDASNWQLWLAQFEYWEESDLCWWSAAPIRTSGTLSYGDAVQVTAVPVAEMLHVLIDQIDYDAPSPMVISTATATIGRNHHGKTVIFESACVVSFDQANLLRPFQCDLIQWGSGQITLEANSYRSYNNAAANTSHTIPDSRYSLHRLALVGWSVGVAQYVVT